MPAPTSSAETGLSLLSDDPSVELSSHRTAMSFERTAMSTDRTLMSIVRTSISLIGFGFTIFQFFHALNERFLEQPLSGAAPRRFGAALILLGIILLALGILNHHRETVQRRARRQRLYELGLIRHAEFKRISSPTVIAVLLLAVGLLAMISVALRTGPF